MKTQKSGKRNSSPRKKQPRRRNPNRKTNVNLNRAANQQNISPQTPNSRNRNASSLSNSNRKPRKIPKKALKRLHGNNRKPTSALRKSTRWDQTNGANQTPGASTSQRKDYQKEIADFLALRGSEPVAGSVTAIPSSELMWVRDESEPQRLSSLPRIPVTSSNVVNVDDELEDGEIVDSQVSGIVDLLEESLATISHSQQIDFSTPFKFEPYFEDRGTSKYGKVPQYSTYGNGDSSFDSKNSSNDDVVCLDSSHGDDSVIFVGEVKPPNTKAQSNLRGETSKLSTPESLKSPVIKNLFKFLPSPGKSEQSKQKRAQRVKAWHEKKKMLHKAKAATVTTDGSMVPSCSAASDIQTAVPSAPVQVQVQAINQLEKREKRPILIDGSNLAMSFTDNYGTRKTDKDFSVEGLKICIDHFEGMGFQVKAVVPEFRCRRDKSSNHALIMELKDNGKLVCTPSKSYDDRVILEAAVKLDAAVVSNDHYRDLINEKPEYRDVVNRLIRFTWMFQKLIIIEDPHGRVGPKLNDILYRKPK